MSEASERRIIVGTGDSPSGLAALRWAVSQARNCQAQLVAVRSWALGLPRHGGRHHRHLAHPRVVLFFRGAEQCDASVKLIRDTFQAATGGQPCDVTRGGPDARGRSGRRAEQHRHPRPAHDRGGPGARAGVAARRPGLGEPVLPVPRGLPVVVVPVREEQP
jgi:hypothetical protein